MRIKTVFWLAMAALIVCGCATPAATLEKRKQEKYGVYSELSPELRARVDQGQIAIGMPMDAVYITWGRPSSITGGESAQGALTTWFYYGNYLQEYRYWAHHGWSGYHRHFIGPTLETGYAPRSYLQGQVTFQNGVVREWQVFPPPPD